VAIFNDDLRDRGTKRRHPARDSGTELAIFGAMPTSKKGETMPYANNGSVRIHYEVEGSGAPLVLHHPTAGRGEDWQHFGYTNVLKCDRRLILLDARGHGASDKPHEPSAYDLPSRVADVTAVLDALQIDRADYFGYSMGGWIGFGIAKYAPQRFRSLILGGAHPYYENMQLFRDLLPREPAAFAAMIDNSFGSYLTAEIRTGLLANDLNVLRALTQDRASLADALPRMSMPCLLYVGEADPRFAQVQECAKVLPNVTFVSLPGCDHVAGLARSDLVLPHLTDFLDGLGQ
jgi:pimeloyl-ACP methyl ester carboxylesterase